MTSGIVHPFTNPKADGGDATVTRPSDWNAQHSATYLSPSGLTGAVQASRYVGATTSGAPVTGTFAVGDFIVDRSGKLWVCTVAGTSGTWVQIGGGGGVTTPVVIDRVSGGTSLVLGSTHPSGTRFILAFDGSSAAATAVTQTNVTWTQLLAHTNAGSAHYELWVGVATGTSGTTVTITTTSAFTSACVGAVADLLTPTLGANVAVDKPNTGDYNLAGVTAGHFVAIMAGNDNTTVNNWIMPMTPVSIVDNNTVGAGLNHGVSLILGYAPTGDMWVSISYQSSIGGLLMAEIT